MTMGASRLRALWEVVIPLVAPGLLSALVFAFIVSFGDVYISLFLSGPGRTTLPIEIFSYMQWESTPVVAAITTVQILLIVVLGLVVVRLVGLRQIMRV
jgi:putative spermidine/putrescine transport system permease protein